MWLNAACFMFILIFLICKKGGGKRDSASKQDSHFPIDLHCQPSEMYHGSDVIGNYLSQQIVSP